MPDTHNSKKRVMLIGLDGMTLDVMKPMVDAGIMPKCKELMERGTWGKLQTVLPPVTGPAWVSCVTGKQPGNHGIFDFFKPTPSQNAVGMSRRIVNSREVDGKPIWRLLTEADKTSIILNVPVTYPPAEIKGAMFTGMLTPSVNSNMTHPPGLHDKLKGDLGEYTITVNWQGYTNATAGQFVQDVIDCAKSRTEYTLRLMDEYPDWDFCFPCYTEPDRIQHALWDYLDPAEMAKAKKAGTYQKSIHDLVHEFYRQLDQHIAALIEKAGDDVPVFFCSDHGFGPLYGKIYVNDYLAKVGLLTYDTWKLKKSMGGLFMKKAYHKVLKTIGLNSVVKKSAVKNAEARQSTSKRTFYDDFYEAIDWDKTIAYMGSNTEGGLYLNVKGRKMYGSMSDKGAIEPEDYEKERDRVIEALRGIKHPDTGESMLSHVFPREEVYSGKYVDRAPDVVFFLCGGAWIADFALEKGSVKRADWRTGCGMHRMDGIFLAAGPGIAHTTDIDTNIINVIPTILATMGLPIPSDMDGKFVDEAFTEEWKGSNTVTYAGDSSGDGQGWGQGDQVYDQEDEDILVDRLRSLGYLD